MIGEQHGDASSFAALIARVAPQPATVLIVGESGTGKELVATALHKQGRPAGGPLVAVNCAAIPPTMMEAELFGYRKGAFSGADRDYPGMFQQADEGTLFLDEVGDLSADCQAKLLRVIETKSFKPLGTTTELKADVRIIAATNRDLEADVRAGPVSPGPVFPAQGGDDPGAAAADACGGHSRSWPSSS